MTPEQWEDTAWALAREAYVLSRPASERLAAERDWYSSAVDDMAHWQAVGRGLAGAVPMTVLHPVTAPAAGDHRPAAAGAWLHLTCARITFTPEDQPPRACDHPCCRMRADNWARLYATTPTATERAPWPFTRMSPSGGQGDPP